MDVQKKLDEIVEAVGNARSMPMSASCVVNRAELLAMLEEVREALPGSLAHAQELLGGREQLVEQARQEAERIIESAHAQRGSLVSDTEIARQSQSEADRILDEARREADEVRAEADEYVDSKLANFEVVLTKTIGSVDRGREKLLGAARPSTNRGTRTRTSPRPRSAAPTRQHCSVAQTTTSTPSSAPSKPCWPRPWRRSARRQKLHGRVATDELGAHMAAQDAAGSQGHTSDEDHWAGLAELAAPEPQPVSQPVQPHFPAQAQPSYAETYAYQEQPQQDMYGYQQQPDPYAAYQQQGYDQGHAQLQAQGYDQGQTQGYDSWQHQPLPQQGLHQQGESALDETSLFDTSMIDLDQLRRYEQER